jgi:hypothetical protein
MIRLALGGLGETVTGQSVEARHFMPEENPEGVLAAFVPFFSGAADRG